MKLLCGLVVFNYFGVIVTTSQATTPCTTPNDEKASCVLLFDCPILLQTANKQDAISRLFVLASACEEKFTVCCGTSSTFTKIPSNIPPSILSIIPSVLPNENKKFQSLSKEAKREYVIKELLPSKNYCGLQHTDDYFYNNTETSVDEFPWLVLIPTKSKVSHMGVLPETELSVGTVINNRYILTDKKMIWGVILMGIHHIYKDISCIGTPFGTDDCTTPSLNEVVEDIITSETSNLQLLRLARTITYSDFVRPICLPLEDSELPKPGDDLVTSGWGEEENTESKDVQIKKRIMHTLLNDRECELGNPLPNPLCAVTLQNSTSYVCPGDNGGPLMYRSTTKNKNWIAMGIIDGIASCVKYQPVVTQRITPEILEWILENIKP